MAPVDSNQFKDAAELETAIADFNETFARIEGEVGRVIVECAM